MSFLRVCFPSQLIRPLHTQVRNLASNSHAHSTANPSEIAHFSRLSSQWWDEQGEFSFLHKMNPIRMQFIRQKLLEISREEDQPSTDEANVLRGLDVLDVGCGGGLLSESLARLGAHTTGIDASESNISIATQHASADPKLTPPALSYIHTLAESLLSSQKRYDVVCSMEVLEHVDNPTSFLSTCAELLKPGGHLFLSTMARTPLAYFLTIFLAENVLGKVSKGTHTHSKYINPSELVEFFQKYRGPIKASSVRDPLDTPISRPKRWISPSSPASEPTRTEAEIRGLIYNPLQANWILAPRGAWFATECNYIFWVRKPRE